MNDHRGWGAYPDAALIARAVAASALRPCVRVRLAADRSRCAGIWSCTRNDLTAPGSAWRHHTINAAVRLVSTLVSTSVRNYFRLHRKFLSHFSWALVAYLCRFTGSLTVTHRCSRIRLWPSSRGHPPFESDSPEPASAALHGP